MQSVRSYLLVGNRLNVLWRHGLVCFWSPFGADPSFPWLNFPSFPVAARHVSGSSPHKSMAAQHKSRGVQPGLPGVFRPDRRRVVEQALFFLLPGEPGELYVEGIIGREECLLAMENRRISAGSLIEAVDLAGTEREFGVRRSAGRSRNRMNAVTTGSRQ
jgi:hypothetical protein